MFITNCCRSLTLYDFDGPPATILDLGCGRGLWAIEAAKQWQVGHAWNIYGSAVILREIAG